MITFNNSIKSMLSEVEIKGKTVNGVSCGIDNGDGTFKITILTTNGLPTTDGNYQECKQDIYMPCKLGQVGNKQDILRFDKGNNRFILEQATNNGTTALATAITHYIDICLNVITYDGKTTLSVQSGSVEAIVKGICPKTMLTSQKFIVNKIREIISALSTQYNDMVNMKKKDIDLQNQINTKSENTHRHNNVATTSDGFMSKEDKVKLNGIANNANNYVHPSDANTRHVTDAEKSSWNAKPTVADVDAKIKAVVGTAPQALDTLKEIGDALGNDADFAGTMTKQLAGKAELVHNHDDRYYTETESDAKYLGIKDKAESAKVADSVAWNSVSDKPSTFPATAHTHDDRYYTETESDNRFLGKTAKAESSKISDSVAWANVTGKPTTFAPSTHTHDDRYFTETESDARFLGINAKAKDSDLLDGQDSSHYAVATHNHDDKYVNVQNGVVTDSFILNTASNTKPVTITREGSLSESLKIGLEDGRSVMQYDNDEVSSSHDIILNNNDTEVLAGTSNGTGANKSSHILKFYGSNTETYLSLDGNRIYHQGYKPTASDVGASPTGHTHDDRYYTETETNNLLNNKVNNTDYSLTTITKNLKIGVDWIDTGITGSNLATGSYMIQISGLASGTDTGFWTEMFTGTMSWYKDQTNNTDSDEILLHKAGHSSTGRTIYLRTIRSANSGYLKLQIACSANIGVATDVIFKFRKLI